MKQEKFYYYIGLWTRPFGLFLKAFFYVDRYIVTVGLSFWSFFESAPKSFIWPGAQETAAFHKAWLVTRE